MNLVLPVLDEGITYSLYIGILTSNSIEKENIRYGIKLKKADNFVKEGNLGELENIETTFNNEEKKEIASTIGETKEIVKIMEASVKKGEAKEYELYLWVDEEVGNTTMGKTFQAGVFVKGTEEYNPEKEQHLTIAEYIKSIYTKDGENNLYYHDGTGEYENAYLEAGDNSYRYAGGDYHLTEKAISNDYNSIYDVIPLKLDSGEVHNNNYWWINNQRYFYLTYDETQNSRYLKPILEQAIKDGYIEKNEVKNYVCFGSSDDECPKENLYRIIGVFNNQVKLVKAGDANKEQLGTNGSFYKSFSHDATYIDDSTYSRDAYYWNKEGANEQAAWANSSLNTINLNTNFVKYLTDLEDGNWIKKIADTDWQVGGMTSQNGFRSNAKTAYDYEVGIKKNPLTEKNKKIGLMYVSDYYYAAPQEYWILMGYDSAFEDVTIDKNTDYRGAIWDNWFWNGDYQWLITPRTENTTGYSFFVAVDGIANTHNVAIINLAVRPCFYLNSNIDYISGDGSLNSPFRIE